MVTIETGTATGATLYLDIHHAELTPAGVRLCAILGDGWYEGEVILEVGEEIALTFADLYLDEGKIRPFLRRTDRGELERAVGAAVGPMKFSVDGRARGRRVQPAGVVAYHHAGHTYLLPQLAGGQGPRPNRTPKARKVAAAA